MERRKHRAMTAMIPEPRPLPDTSPTIMESVAPGSCASSTKS